MLLPQRVFRQLIFIKEPRRLFFLLFTKGDFMSSDFLHQIKQVMFRNRDGSHATQAERRKIMKLIDKQLKEMGVRNLQLQNMKYKHIQKLLNKWKEQELSAGTIKNRMSHIRWLTEKIDKKGICPNSNATLGIERRVYVTNINHAKNLSSESLAKISDPYLVCSFKLQAAFGLRKEESMKIQLRFSDQGEKLVIVKSKGNRPREVPIRTDYQRQTLNEAKEIAKSGSLIPPHLKYVQQKARYERACVTMGLDRAHGLRHAYAQNRYRELTGTDAPAVTGESTKIYVVMKSYAIMKLG